MLNKINIESIKNAVKDIYKISKQATCIRRQVGCRIYTLNEDYDLVPTSHIGFNGPLECDIQCNSESCIRSQKNIPSGQRPDLCRAVHAEQRAIANFPKYPNDYSVLFCTTKPCFTCMRLIINSEINGIVFCESYNDEMTATFIDHISKSNFENRISIMHYDTMFGTKNIIC